jgi:hypothetical protein
MFHLYNMSRLLLCSISTICQDCCYVPSLQYVRIVAMFHLYNMSRLLLCSISTICHDCCYVPSLQYITIVSGGAGTVNPSEAAGRSPPSDIGNLSRMLLFRLNPLVILVLMTHILFGFPILNKTKII